MPKFARFAKEVWAVSSEGKAEEEIALAGIQALADFIKEIGLPTSFAEMNIELDDETRKKIAASTVITGGCCRKLTAEEIETILKKCQ